MTGIRIGVLKSLTAYKFHAMKVCRPSYFSVYKRCCSLCIVLPIPYLEEVKIVGSYDAVGHRL